MHSPKNYKIDTKEVHLKPRVSWVDLDGFAFLGLGSVLGHQGPEDDHAKNISDSVE